MFTDAYKYALLMLAQGGMPIIIPAGDELHIVVTVPTNMESAKRMLSEDGAERATYLVRSVVGVRRHFALNDV